MPRASLNGVELYYEETGQGFPVVFCHEFAGDFRSWAPQVRALSRYFRCVTLSYRGFPPSSVPLAEEAYSQNILVEDLRALCDHLSIDQAYFVGLSMGGHLVLSFAIKYPQYCRAIVPAGAGSGATNREQWLADIERTVHLLRTQGCRVWSESYSLGANRVQFKRKDPAGWQEFKAHMAQHDPIGQSNMMLGVQRQRPTIFDMESGLAALEMPTLIIIGDEDEPCVDPAVFMKRRIKRAGLKVFPQSGHTINLEEPAGFNQCLLDFFRSVESGAWAERGAVTTSLLPAGSR